MKHKHYNIIVAWAAGTVCQYREGEKWKDLPTPASHEMTPAFFDAMEYRIKPNTKKYRVYIWKGSNGNIWNGVVDDAAEAEVKENSDSFVRWISDWVTYEVSDE